MQQKKADFLLPNRKKVIPLQHGKLAEWSNATVSKAVDLHGSGGSNPSLSAKKEALRLPFSVYTYIIVVFSVDYCSESSIQRLSTAKRRQRLRASVGACELSVSTRL